MLFFPLINVKMPTFVSILTFMGRKKIIFITSGPGDARDKAVASDKQQSAPIWDNCNSHVLH